MREIDSNQLQVSILVPCYNVENYLRQCLDSLINQTLKNIEIICINDGSTDSTYSILKEYSNLDERVRVINKENSGYGDSMNLGLKVASGEYIGIVESDDYVDKNMFHYLYVKAKSDELDICRCSYYSFNASGKKLENNEFISKNIVLNPNSELSVFLQAPAIWSSIYNRDWLMKNNICFLPTPGASFQDISFAFKAYAHCRRFCMLNEALIFYRTDNDASSSNSNKKIFCVCDEWSEIYNFVRENKQFNYLLPTMFRMKQSNYKWNYKRLTLGAKIRFLKRWIFEDFQHVLYREVQVSALARLLIEYLR